MINRRRHEHLIKIAVQQLIVKALCYKRSSELPFQAVLHQVLEGKPAPCSFPPLTRVQLAHSPRTGRAEMSLPFRETSPRPIDVRWTSQARGNTATQAPYVEMQSSAWRWASSLAIFCAKPISLP